MKLVTSTIGQLARTTSGNLAWVESFAKQIAARANSDSSDAISGRAYDGDGRGGSELTQPERYAEAAISGHLHDSAGDLAKELMFELRAAEQAARRARKVAGMILTSQEERDQSAARKLAGADKTPGNGNCIICTCYCSGIRTDRLVSGRCNTCLVYWERHHREEDRPRELWDQEKAS